MTGPLARAVARSRVPELGTLTTSTTSGDIAPIALSSPITSGNIIEITIDPTSANDGAIEYVSFVADAWLALVAQATEPGTGDTQVAMGFKVTRGNDDQSTDFGSGSIYVWRGSTDSQLYFATARPQDQGAAVTVYQTNLGGPEGPTGATGAAGADGTDGTDGTDGDIAGIDAGTGIRIDDGGTTTPEVNIANNANLPGNPTTTTQATGNNSTRIATTAFVKDQGYGTGTGDVTGIDAGDGIRIDDGATSTPEVNIDDDSVVQDMIADDAVGVDQLKIGSWQRDRFAWIADCPTNGPLDIYRYSFVASETDRRPVRSGASILNASA